jgi:hypothetical protein
VPAGALAIDGDALAATSIAAAAVDDGTLVHLVGTPHPNPSKAAEFERVDIASIRASGVEVAPVWMGGGRVEDVTRLERAGVDVTGWIPHAEVGSRLVQSDVYLHTAAWEGFLLAVLEAVQAGVPTLVRPIAAFGVVPDALTLEGGLEAMVASRLAGPQAFAAWAERNVSRWSERLKEHTPARQRAALAEAYRIPRVA